MFEPAQLQNVWLAEVHFEENSDFAASDRGTVSYQVEPEVVIEDLHASSEDDETHAVVWIRAKVNWFQDDEPAPPEAVPFALETAVRAFFVWDSASVDERRARAWLDYNGMWLMWPYVRTYINMVTGLSRLPSLTIYTMNVPESPDFDSEEDVRVTEPDAAKEADS